MGYFGLDNFEDSDNASDLAYDIVMAVNKILSDHLRKEKGNEYNTDGSVNVALFFEAFLTGHNNWEDFDSLHETAIKTIDALKNKIKKEQKNKWEDEVNKQEHLGAYKRMIKSLESFC